MEKCLKNGYFDYKIKNFHKSNDDGLKKFSIRAYLFHDLFHFRECSFIKGEILEKSIIRFLTLFQARSGITFPSQTGQILPTYTFGYINPLNDFIFHNIVLSKIF